MKLLPKILASTAIKKEAHLPGKTNSLQGMKQFPLFIIHKA